MALHFHTSNKLEILIDKINRNMLQHSNGDVLQCDWVIVPNNGIATYLKQQLARRNGICANLQIRKIAEFYNQTVTAEERVRPSALRWKLFAYFVSEHSRLPREVTDYLQQSGGNNLELRAWQLSGRLLQIFDQYRTFRYDKLKEILTHDNWQSDLFKIVFGENLSKRLQALNNLASYQQNTPRVLHIFGFGSMPKLYLDFIYNLARMKDKELFFYYLSPSMEFFGDQYFNRGSRKFIPQNFDSEAVLNPLFSAWGAQALGLLELTLNGQDVIETFDDENFDLYPDTALGRLQNSILTLSDPAEDSGILDHTLQIHSCHTIRREVEVLHDLLLREISLHGALPREIMVVAPDMNLYAPYIEAVFGRSDSPLRGLYTISDRNYLSCNKTVDSFMNILQQSRSRLTLDEVITLLETPAVSAKFKLSEAEIGRLAGYLRSGGVRWGENKADHARFAQVAFDEYSWESGLDNILFGFARRRGEALNQVDPFPGVELLSGGEITVVDKFIRFYQVLTAWRRFFISNPLLSVGEWIVELRQLSNEFFASTRDYALQFMTLQNAFAALAADAELTATRVSADLMRSALQEYFEQSGENGFLRGRITFSTFFPQRGIPHGVIAMLGMNEGDFPRQDQHYNFNFMQLAPEAWDRIRVLEDRYAFLEMFLAARKSFIVTYQGRNATTNEKKNPSVVIQELLDAMKKCFPADNLVIQHHLQPFAPDYFIGDGELFSYSEENYRAAQQLCRRKLSQKSEAWRVAAGEELPPLNVNLTDLISFFRNPCRYFLQSGCDIYFRDLNALEDEEVIVLDGLQNYFLREQVWREFVSSGKITPEALYNYLKKSNRLPPGSAGKIIFERCRDNIFNFQNLTPEDKKIFQSEPVLISSPVGEKYVLSGKLTVNADFSRQVFFTASTSFGGYIEARLRHLTLLAHLNGQWGDNWGGHEAVTQFYSSSKDKVAVSTLHSDTGSTAELAALLDIFVEGQHRAVEIFPNITEVLIKQLRQLVQGGRRLEDITAPELDWKSPEALFAKFFKDDPWSDFTRKDAYVAHYYRPDGLGKAEIRDNALKYAKKMINFGGDQKNSGESRI